MKRALVALCLMLLTAVPARADGLGTVLSIRFDDLTVSKDEFFCLALNDYWEARGEALDGRIAVAMVVLNRAMERRYPSNICDVVRQNRSPLPGRCQFSWFCDSRPDKPLEWRAWQSSLKLAAAVLDRESHIVDPTQGALWYHADFVNPVWARSLTKVAQLGDHIFYTDVPQSELARRALDPDALLPKGGKFSGWQEARTLRNTTTQMANSSASSAVAGQ